MVIVARDFNATFSHVEKRGNGVVENKVQQDFQHFFTHNGLCEVVAKGEDYTWTNRRKGFSNITEKLDKFFLAGNWNLQPLLYEDEISRFVMIGSFLDGPKYSKGLHSLKVPI